MSAAEPKARKRQPDQGTRPASTATPRPSCVTVEEIVKSASAETFVQLLQQAYGPQLAAAVKQAGVPPREVMAALEHSLPGWLPAWRAHCDAIGAVRPHRLQGELESSSWTQESYAQAIGYLVGVAVGRMRIALDGSDETASAFFPKLSGR